MQLGYLQGLRALCALWVLAAHEAMIFLPMAVSGEAGLQHLEGPWEGFVARLPLQEVNFGVCLFFLISAFVLSLRYWQQEERGTGCLADAACRRYFRLALPVLGAMLLAWLLARAGWMRNAAVSEVTLTSAIIGGNGALVFQSPVSFSEMLQGALYQVYAQVGWEALARQFDFVLWTMPYEMQGSFLSLAFLALLGTVKRRDAFYLSFCCLAGASGSYFLAFPLGLWLADVHYARDREALRACLARLRLLPWLCLLLGLYLGFFRDVPGNPLYDWLRERLYWQGLDRPALLHTLGGFCFLFAVLRLKALQRVLGSRVLASLGQYSFALYLVHVPVLCSAEAALFLHFFYGGMGYGASLALAFLLSLPLLALLTVLLNRCFDEPAKQLSRRVAHWLLGGKAKP